MALSQRFEEAQQQVKRLATTPAADELLTLYALYKQATEGDVQGKRPGMLDVKARMKFDAWTKQRGSSRDEAMQQYVDLVERLVS